MTQATLIKATNVTKLPMMTSSSALSAFEMLVNSHKEYKMIAERELTKREMIKTWKETHLAQIQAQQEILRDYLKYTFAERKTAIDGFFEVLDKGFESNNLEMINMAIGGIVGIVKTSPLQQVESLMLCLNDDGVKHIEF